MEKEYPAIQHNINWKILSDAERYYKNKLKSTYIEVPWLVSENTRKITSDSIEFITNYGQLVGSAEQGFLQLILDNKLSLSNDKYYHSISPCFREDNIDAIHEHFFMKLELIYLPKNTTELKKLDKMIKVANFFFSKYTKTKVINTSYLNFDIVTKETDIELGSYGIREYNGIKWIYGTGVSLPRLSIAIK